MFWTSIRNKLRHTIRIILTYTAYEANLSSLMFRLNYVALLALPLLMSVFL